MTLNTGLLLRQPFESDYSALRRFLIANRHCRLRAIKSQLARLTNVGGNATKTCLKNQSQQWEAQFCENYRISYARPYKIGTKVARKNCPDCARLGYHSYLYEYPWLNQCAIHKRSLVRACPVCDQPWPAPSAMLESHCPCCSVRGFAKHWEQTKALTTLIEREYGAINTLLEQEGSTPNAFLFSQHAHHRQSNCHQSADPGDTHWPSYVAHSNHNKQSVFESLSVDVLPVVECGYAIPGHCRSTQRSRSSEGRRELFLRNRFRKRIDQRMAARFGETVLNRATRLGDGNDRSIAELAHLSRENWWVIVHNGSNGCAHLPYVDGCQAFRSLSNELMIPPSPCLMTHLIFGRPLQWMDQLDRKPSLGCSLPLGLQVWIYQLDLWWTYLAVFHFFDAILALPKSRVVRHDLFERFREQGHPNTWWTKPRFHITEASPGGLRLRVLEAVALGSLDDLVPMSG